MMAANEGEADDLGRLEAALERIAALAQRPQPAAAPAIDTTALSSRLDRLIGQIQDALAEPGPAQVAAEPGPATDATAMSEA